MHTVSGFSGTLSTILQESIRSLARKSTKTDRAMGWQNKCR